MCALHRYLNSKAGNLERGEGKRFLKPAAELDTEDRNLLLWAFSKVR